MRSQAARTHQAVERAITSSINDVTSAHAFGWFAHCGLIYLRIAVGLGAGFNYVGEREGDLLNSFQADSYFLTNAAIFYRRDNWRFALNFKNLFDVNYIKSVENGRLGANSPGETFTVIGSVSVQF